MVYKTCMIDYKSVVIDTIGSASDLCAIETTSWKTVDMKIRTIILGMKLYHCFSTDTHPHKDFWRATMLPRVNDLIIVRNCKLAECDPSPLLIADIQYNLKYGPLGVIIYLACIRDNAWRIQEGLLLDKFQARCMFCDYSFMTSEMTMSQECDVHAPWSCTRCASNNIVVDGARQVQRHAEVVEHQL